MINISASDLRRAADIQDEIEGLNGELNKILGGGTSVGNGVKRRGRKPKVSGDVDRFKEDHGMKPKRKMSAAGRAKIAAAARARWAKAKAAGKKSL